MDNLVIIIGGIIILVAVSLGVYFFTRNDEDENDKEDIIDKALKATGMDKIAETDNGFSNVKELFSGDSEVPFKIEEFDGIVSKMPKIFRCLINKMKESDGISINDLNLKLVKNVNEDKYTHINTNKSESKEEDIKDFELFTLLLIYYIIKDMKKEFIEFYILIFGLPKFRERVNMVVKYDRVSDDNVILYIHSKDVEENENKDDYVDDIYMDLTNNEYVKIDLEKVYNSYRENISSRNNDEMNNIVTAMEKISNCEI